MAGSNTCRANRLEYCPQCRTRRGESFGRMLLRRRNNNRTCSIQRGRECSSYHLASGIVPLSFPCGREDRTLRNSSHRHHRRDTFRELSNHHQRYSMIRESFIRIRSREWGTNNRIKMLKHIVNSIVILLVSCTSSQIANALDDNSTELLIHGFTADKSLYQRSSENYISDAISNLIMDFYDDNVCDINNINVSWFTKLIPQLDPSRALRRYLNGRSKLPVICPNGNLPMNKYGNSFDSVRCDKSTQLWVIDDGKNSSSNSLMCNCDISNIIDKHGSLLKYEDETQLLKEISNGHNFGIYSFYANCPDGMQPKYQRDPHWHIDYREKNIIHIFCDLSTQVWSLVTYSPQRGSMWVPLEGVVACINV
eukprot:898115_1